VSSISKKNRIARFIFYAVLFACGVIVFGIGPVLLWEYIPLKILYWVFMVGFWGIIIFVIGKIVDHEVKSKTDKSKPAEDNENIDLLK
jgi:TRAP-type C4-dicarboxylate transport system permease small subunit